MAGKGSAPGERRGGRQPGIKNKNTIEREIIAQRIIAEQKQQPGRKLAKEVLDDFMHLFMGLAAQYQPLPHGVAAAPGQKPDEAKFVQYAQMAGDFAGKLVKYQSPTMGIHKIQLEPRFDSPAGDGALPAPVAPGQVQQLTPSQAYRLFRDADWIDIEGDEPAKPAPKRKAANG